MPRFHITSPEGREVVLEGDTEPTDAELDEIFASLPPKQPETKGPGLFVTPERDFYSPTFGQTNLPPRNPMTGGFEPAPPADYVAPGIFEEMGGALSSPLEAAGKVVVGGLNLPTTIQNFVEQDILKNGTAPLEPLYKYGEGLVNLTPEFTEEELSRMEPWQQRIAGGARAVGGALTQLTTPENLATIPLFGSAKIAKPLAAYLLGIVGLHEPAAIEKAINLAQDPDVSPVDAAAAFTEAAIINPAFAALLGKQAKGPTGKAAAIQAIVEQLKSEVQPRATVNESAVIRSGLPPRAAAPEVLPELQRTRDLADQAVREATQKIVEPGKVPAIEQLKAQGNEIVPVEARVQKPQTGFERPAEEVMRGRTVAEKSMEAVAEPAKPVEAVKLPETEAAYNLPEKPEVAKLGEQSRKNSYGDPSGTVYRATPEDWQVWQDISSKPLTEPGAWATREAIKNKYGGMPPEGPKVADVAPKFESPAEIVIETPPDIISKLQSLKVDPKKGLPPGQTFSLPHPDAIKVIGKQLWNDALDVAITAVKAGRTIKAGIAEAISHIKRNARNYDETQIRKNLESILEKEGVAKKPKPAEDIPASPASGIESPEGQKQRSLSARATVSEKIPEPVQEAIKTDPRSSYTPQSVPEVAQQVKGMTDAQLFSLKPDGTDANYTSGRAELVNRLAERGDNQSVLDVVQETSEALTRAGQIINQAKFLNALKPEVQVSALNETLKKAGKDPLTEAQTKKALDLAREAKAKEAELEAATTAWKNNPTPENAAKAEVALDKSNAAALESQKFQNNFQPRYTSALLKSILQGNLLTPISQTANLVGNLSFLPFRAGSRGVAASLDVIQSAITGRKRTSSVGPVTGTAEAAKGLARGAAKMPSILKEGTGNVVLGETRQGLHPVKAWMRQFSSNPDMPTKGGKIGLKERLNLFLEGTLGIPAEAMLRGLGAVDQPFREAAKARATAEQLRLANIPKEQWVMAQKFPELFFEGKVLETIKQESDFAVFQRTSPTLNHLTKWIASKGPVFDLAVATVAPYKLTPWNIIGEILSYNPIVAFVKGSRAAIEGNRRDANLNAGKLVVGSILTTAAYELYKQGLLSPSLDSRDEQMKERILSGQVMPPNHINITGLERYLKGGDPAFQPGDKTVDVMRSGGLAGAFMYMTANVGRDLEKNPEGDSSDLIKSILTQSTLEQARFGMNQSFLQGVEGLLSAVKDGNADSYIAKWANTVTSIPLPNTLTALSRATRDDKPELTGDSLDKKIENVFRNRLGFAGFDEALPVKRGLWGEPLPETPKGRNPYAYHFFDVGKGQQITDDPKTLEMYRLWRKTDDSRAIPTPPSNKLTVRQTTYILTPEQKDRLQELVGQRRSEIMDIVIANPFWQELNDEQKISRLQKIYDKGLERGKKQFLMENEGKLEAKKPKAGFQLP